jgi:hypothetical protein
MGNMYQYIQDLPFQKFMEITNMKLYKTNKPCTKPSRYFGFKTWKDYFPSFFFKTIQNMYN